MTQSPRYLEQWHRVLRWYQRFRDISENKPISQSTDNDEDDVLAFFTNCYHLKDWIKEDPSFGESRHTVESYVDQSQGLKICADLCNGAKHSTLTSSKSEVNPQLTARTQRIYLQDEPIKVCRGFLITSDNGSYEAFDIAFQCMMDWHKFIYLNRAPA